MSVREELLKLYTPEQVRDLETVRSKLMDDPSALDTKRSEKDGGQESPR